MPARIARAGPAGRGFRRTEAPGPRVREPAVVKYVTDANALDEAAPDGDYMQL
jgi:hypothetical protein